MANKLSKLFLSSVALIASAAAVAGCDDIEAKPEWDENNTILNCADLTNNEMMKLWDTLVTSGASNSEKVLTNLLKQLSKAYFGGFYTEDGVVGLVDAVADDAKLTAFVDSHPNFKVSLDQKEDDKGKARVKMYYDYLEQKINEEFIAIAKNSSYQERSEFSEAEWVKTIIANGYDVETPATPVKKKVNGNDDYKKAASYFHEGYIKDYKDYIERSILPSLYQNKLVEYFIMQVNPGVIGRTYARKIEYVKVSDNAEYPVAMKKLIKAYAEKVIKAGEADTYDFDYLSDLIKGTVDYKTDTKAAEIYTAANFDFANERHYKIVVNGAEKDVYALPETTLGGYFKTYAKITDNRFTNDKAAYDEYTSNGAYKKEVGLQIKYDTLVASSSNATDGWYTQSSLSGIPSDLKNRLFKVRVASELDTEATAPTYDYGVVVGGGYYVTPESYERGNEFPYIVYSDSASYIVRVNEAVSVSKLKAADASTDKNYDEMPAKAGRNADLPREGIAYDVTHLISDNETYSKNAKQYFIKDLAIDFHDDYVYDYFAEQFPDLFESNED